MAFVVDKGLDVLRDQIDAKAPNRSKASDGSIGDPAHAARDSDHNPERTRDSSDGNDPDYQVDARDFTHDPAYGADMGKIAEALRLSKDRRIQYVIFNRRIFSSYASGGVPAWTWRPYSGSDPHTGHMHISVVDNPNDVTTPWSIGDDMEQSDTLVQVTGYKGRTVGHVLADVSNLRDWLYAVPGAKTTNPPPPGSNADLLVKAAQRPAVDVAALATALAPLIENGASLAEIESALRAVLNSTTLKA